MVDISPAAWLLAAAACRITPALMISTPATACRAAASACASTGSALSCAPSEGGQAQGQRQQHILALAIGDKQMAVARTHGGFLRPLLRTQPLNRPKGSSCQAPRFGPPNGLYNAQGSIAPEMTGALSWRSCASCVAASSVRRCCWNRASQPFCVCLAERRGMKQVRGAPARPGFGRAPGVGPVGRADQHRHAAAPR